ncbi:MAG: hypothetical protein IPK83_24480 [Planctomycetes bacterium]|nr:hypothetical protein [Planctomycetota bacterium]
MKREDNHILKSLFDKVEEIAKKSGRVPEPNRLPLVERLEVELDRYEKDVVSGKLTGRAQRRKSGELFLRILSAYREIFET